jgi:hypothetical protein
VELESTVNSVASYQIISTQGQLTRTGQVSLHTGMNNLDLPLQDLPKGVYQFAITQKDKSLPPVSFRFVKQ